MSLIQGRTGSWEIVIGLEVHAQIVSKAKLFSGAATDFGAKVGHPLAHFGSLENSVGLRIDEIDNLPGGAGRRHQSIPRRRVHALEPELDDGRNAIVVRDP